MPEIHAWWLSNPEERFWLEVTRRSDLGANLRAPQTAENGQPYWSYSLIKYLRPGDRVFHYDGNAQEIVAQSVAVGEHWEDEVLWAARGLSARSAGIQPHTRPGWYLGLEEFTLLSAPVPLVTLRERTPDIKALTEDLRLSYGNPLYFPFEIAGRPLRPMQGYLFKLPRRLIELLDIDLGGQDFGKNDDAPPAPASIELYRKADEQASVAERDAFSIDPGLIERGIRGHAATQNRVAAFLLSIGLQPTSPLAAEPNFDIAWRTPDRFYVAEVKSLTDQNEEKQMRLGLGQVLRYAHMMRARNAAPVLILERKPRDTSWIELCASLGVLLVWPEILTGSNWPLVS